MLLVGAQPGDVDDRTGRPFIGPAGAVLWACVEQSGVDRDIDATIAVKHFEHELRGARRIHERPSTEEDRAWHPWLDAEVHDAMDAP